MRRGPSQQVYHHLLALWPFLTPSLGANETPHNFIHPYALVEWYVYLNLSSCNWVYHFVTHSLVQGMDKSAFIASEDSVGIWMWISPLMSLSNLVQTAGLLALTLSDNWVELSLALILSQICLKFNDHLCTVLLASFRESTLGCCAWMNVNGYINNLIE